MSDIFVSYASEDRERILPLVRALEKTGWSLFWDKEIPAGKTWRQVIGSEIKNCRCVLVVWTNISVNKEWVLEEAGVGKKKNILIPVKLDEVEPPFGFTSIQAADLVTWDGSFSASSFHKLVLDLSSLLGVSPTIETAQQQKQTDKNPPQRAEIDRPAKQEEHIPDITKSVRPGTNKQIPVAGGGSLVSLTKRMRYGILGLIAFIALSTLIVLFMQQESEQASIDWGEQETEGIIKERELAERKSAQEAEAKRREKENIKRQEAQIAELLGRAREAMNSSRLTTPPEENAVSYYREVLQLDPENREARKGLEHIAGQYIAWADEALHARQADKAEEHLKKARFVEPLHHGVIELAQKIGRLRAQQDEQSRSRTTLAAERKRKEELQRLEQERKNKEELIRLENELAKKATLTFDAGANDRKAEIEVSGDDIKRLLSGKTVVGRNIKWGTKHKTYFEPFGELRRIDSSNYRETRNWRVWRGKLCLEGGREKCHKVMKRSDGGYNMYRKGELKFTYDKIVDGNPYNL